MTKPLSTTTLVKKLQATGQDHEWYPTTQEMIKVIQRHMLKAHKSHNYPDKVNASILDCGAGDGRVLATLADYGEKYAIEKSAILIGQQPIDVIPVGTDFHAATLIDKPVDVVFSNPPYSEYEQWATKIIREANAPDVYLIIPARWQNSQQIKHAIESREAEASVIYSGDFLEADRAARAKIEIIHIDLSSKRYRRHHGDTNVDPFNVWFDETFPRNEPKTEAPKEEKLKDEINSQMVNGRNLIDALVELYQRDMDKLAKNYQAACQLDGDLMAELQVLIESRNSLPAMLQKALKQRIKGLKHLYWHEFFSNYASITDRLATTSRKAMLDTLHGNVNVDFTAANAYAITLWVIKNANRYYDQQLIELVERMTRQANISLYKSNQRTFGAEAWRHNTYRRERSPEGLTHYQLEYRIVLENMGGIHNREYGSWDAPGGLEKHSHEFISDILAVAKTLGWTCNDTSQSRGHFKRTWESNKSQQFICENGDVLMDVKAFKNGNLHIKFAQKFMKKLNVEFGRLKGWLKDKHQAAEELRITPEEATEFFSANLQIGVNSSVLFLTQQNADVRIQEEKIKKTATQEEPEQASPANSQAIAPAVLELFPALAA